MSKDGVGLRVVRAGLLAATADAIFGIAQYMIAKIPSPVTRFFQGIASVLLGKRPPHGGMPAVGLGLAMHIAVGMFWAAFFALVVIRSSWVRERLKSPAGILIIAALYGPFIWMSMSLIVITPLVHHPPRLNQDWWIQFFGHMLSAGLPIAFVFRGRRART
jgi:hypothetical protein